MVLSTYLEDIFDHSEPGSIAEISEAPLSAIPEKEMETAAVRRSRSERTPCMTAARWQTQDAENLNRAMNMPLLSEPENEPTAAAAERAGGNKKRATELLGIHRPTLYAKLKRFGIAL